jgi:hypothetical protein
MRKLSVEDSLFGLENGQRITFLPDGKNCVILTFTEYKIDENGILCAEFDSGKYLWPFYNLKLGQVHGHYAKDNYLVDED